MPVSAESEHERAANERQLEIYRAMPQARRLEQALRMNRAMRELMAAGFRRRHPEWDEARVRRSVADQILYAGTG